MEDDQLKKLIYQYFKNTNNTPEDLKRDIDNIYSKVITDSFPKYQPKTVIMLDGKQEDYKESRKKVIHEVYSDESVLDHQNYS